MDVKLELYRTFREVARRGSFSAAAEALFISQSAVSQSIKNLESQLGVALFDRRGKQIALTPEGRLLYGYIDEGLKSIRQGEEQLGQYAKLEKGELKIGVSDTISRFVILNQLDSFHRIYPYIHLSIINGTSIEAVQMLKSRDVDIAFVNSPVKDAALEEHPFFKVHDVFVAGDEYRHLAGRPLTARQLADLPLILLERKSTARRRIDRLFAQQGIQIAPEIELGSHDLLLDLARINLGVSCVIEEFAAHYLKWNLVFKLQTEFAVPARWVSWCKLKSSALSPSGQIFADLIGTAPTVLQ